MKRKIIYGMLALVFLFAGLPFLNADVFGPRIRAGLENALGRRVEIGAVHLHLLTGPGFSVSDVVIHEDPVISAEPFAYVDDLVVRIRLLSLVSGRLEFSSLRLDKPHVNLTRNDSGEWNVRRLIAPPPAGSPAAQSKPSHLPELEVRRGRLNFKFNDLKSAFYFTGADIDFSSSGGDSFDIWFVGEPARTDRIARGFGRITAQGRFRESNAGPLLDLELHLDRSDLGETVILAGGRDAGIHGALQARIQVGGPLSNLKINGEIEARELHHWSQPPRDASVQTKISGKLDLPAQSLHLETDPKQPLTATLDLNDFLASSKWSLRLKAIDCPLDSTAEWLRPASQEFNGMLLKGNVTGEASATDAAPVSGAATVNNFEWNWQESNHLAAETLQAEWMDGILHLSPASFNLDGQPVQVECETEMSSLTWECRGSSKGLHDAVKLRNWTRALGLQADWLEGLAAGTLRGTLTVRQSGLEPPAWRGNLELRNAELSVPELASPVRISSASVNWQQPRLVIQPLRASSGNLHWTGSYRFDPSLPRMHRAVVEAEELTYLDLERLLRPLLRRQTGFLRRALGMEETAASTPAEVDLRARSLSLGFDSLENFHVTAIREPNRVVLSAITATANSIPVAGEGVVRLASGAADFDLKGHIAPFPWERGTVEADWKIVTRGGSPHLEAIVRAAQNVLAGQNVETLRGRIRIDTSTKPVRLLLDQLEAQADDNKLLGRTAPGPDGSQLIQFTGTGGAFTLQVTFAPFSVAAITP